MNLSISTRKVIWLAGLKPGHNGNDNKKIVKCVRLKDLLNEEIDFLKIDMKVLNMRY